MSMVNYLINGVRTCVDPEHNFVLHLHHRLAVLKRVDRVRNKVGGHWNGHFKMVPLPIGFSLAGCANVQQMVVSHQFTN